MADSDSLFYLKNQFYLGKGFSLWFRHVTHTELQAHIKPYRKTPYHQNRLLNISPLSSTQLARS